MSRRIAVNRLHIAILALFLILLIPSCESVRDLFCWSPRPANSGTTTTGRLEKVSGVNVLTLWGTPYERGVAHGRLLAQPILDMVDAVCGTTLLLDNTQNYTQVILPLMDRFKFDPDDEAELKGIYDGVIATLGEKAVLQNLGRPLELRDLRAYNCVGDWYRQGCSSMAAWGKRTVGGHVWIGRNFDFLPCRPFYAHQLIIVHQRQGDKKAWMTVSAPGMIGCITGVNEDGVFVSLHDVFLKLRPLENGYYPRLFTTRRLMEQCSARDLEAQARPLLESRKQMFDNAILLAAPVKDGTPSAIVFEYNNDYSKDKGVTVRTPKDNEAELGGDAILCINAFEKRTLDAPNYPLVAAVKYRRDVMRRVLTKAAADGKPIAFDQVWDAMHGAAVPITIHTVIVDLNTFDYWYVSGDFLESPRALNLRSLPIKEWLAGNDANPPAVTSEPAAAR